jgi:hypothetical protein
MQVVQVGQLKKDFSTILKAVQNNDVIFIIELMLRTLMIFPLK